MTTELVRVNDTPDTGPGLPNTGITPAGDDLVSAWLAGRKATTFREYSKDLRYFAAWYLPDSHATPDMALAFLLSRSAGDANLAVLNYRSAMVDRGLSAATVNRRLASLRSVVKLARTLGRVAWSVEIDGLKPERRHDRRGPDDDGLRKIKKALRKSSKRDHAVFALLFGLGLRRAEVGSLVLADVDFVAMKVHVLGKGRREKIALNLEPPVARAVGDWVLVRGSHPGPLFHRAIPKGRGQTEPEPLNLGTFNRILDALGRSAGLPGKLRPHGCRHSAITQLFKRGKTVPEVMSFSRHANPKNVMDYYDALNDSAGAMAGEVAKMLD